MEFLYGDIKWIRSSSNTCAEVNAELLATMYKNCLAKSPCEKKAEYLYDIACDPQKIIRKHGQQKQLDEQIGEGGGAMPEAGM